MTVIKLLLPFLILLSFLSSCSQHVKFSPRKCIAPEANWSLATDVSDIEITEHIRTDGEYTFLRRVLDRNKKNCHDIEKISLTHKYTYGDFLWNMLPFTGRSTLIVKIKQKKKADIK